VELSSQDLQYKDAKEQTLNLFNKNYISNLLSVSRGNVTQAAKFCGLERQALQQIMRRYGISAEDFRQEQGHSDQ
jgi:DNA-binding NtrC family response regulator